MGWLDCLFLVLPLWQCDKSLKSTNLVQGWVNRAVTATTCYCLLVISNFNNDCIGHRILPSTQHHPPHIWTHVGAIGAIEGVSVPFITTLLLMQAGAYPHKTSRKQEPTWSSEPWIIIKCKCRTSCMDIQSVLLHRALHSGGPHTWCNALLVPSWNSY